ncbi:50S ribosomal protein, putative [Babesia caballi]|uniref:50S ribosomal protein, putative n=1 Tax=Babesia caballi TaxID=5871 RepID=A0AAV4LZP2_BABCB|nr:50S ribosomal protein, putative [Babesia caballi]
MLWLAIILTTALSAGVERRNNSLGNLLVRYVTQRSDYNDNDQEYARVTQAPMVRMHLRKVFLPSTLHEAMKPPLSEQLLERRRMFNAEGRITFPGASVVDGDNAGERNRINEAVSAVDELEVLSAQPLRRMNAHNFGEREFKAVLSSANEPRKEVARIIQVNRRLAMLPDPIQGPIGLSDFAVIPSRRETDEPNSYLLLERRKLKPSEMDDDDAERLHVPIFPVWPDRYLHI